MLLLGVACTRKAAQPTTAPALYIAGCKRLLDTSQCLTRERRPVVVWAQTYVRTPPRLSIDGRILPIDPVPYENGWRFELSPAPTGKLRYEQGELRQLIGELHPAPQPSPHLRRLDALLRVDQQAALAQLMSSPGPELEMWERALAWARLGRVMRNAGDIPGAQDALDRAVLLHKSLGDSHSIVDDLSVKMNTLIHSQRDLAAAQRTLETMVPALPWDGESRVVVDYYSGILALHSGLYRSAVEHLSASLALAERIGSKYLVSATISLSRSHAELGDHRQARRHLNSLDRIESVLSPCRQLDVVGHRLWSLLMELEAGHQGKLSANRLDRIETLQKRALTLQRTGCTIYPDGEVNLILNQALVALHLKNYPGAARNLAAAAKHPDQPPLARAWHTLIAARLALATAKPSSALTLFTRLAKQAEEFVIPSARWHAAVGLALAYAQHGDVGAADKAFDRADKLLKQHSLAVPIHRGRGEFLSQRHYATRKRVAFLLRQKRDKEAMDQVRRSQAQLLLGTQWQAQHRSLSGERLKLWRQGLTTVRESQARLVAATAEVRRVATSRLPAARAELARSGSAARAQLDAFLAQSTHLSSSIQLRPADPGELLLAFFDLDDGWAGFAQTEDATIVLRGAKLPDPEAAKDARSEALFTGLVLPFAEQVAKASRVRIFAPPALQALDIHSMLERAAPGESAPAVAYGLDVGGRNTPAPRPDRGTLIVADPTDDLPLARQEGELIADALADNASLLLQGDMATRTRVLAEIGRAAAFHFAGHANVTDDGWHTALSLAEDATLTVGDVLTLERVPRTVVLNACGSGRNKAFGSVIDMGLAHAFVAAGARATVATRRAVRDSTALGFSRAFYAHPERTVEQRYNSAVGHIRRSTPNADWKSFRLFLN